MPNAKDYQTSLPGYFSLTEAAEFLGYRSTSALRKLCLESRIVCYKVGKTWLLPVEQVDALESMDGQGYGGRGMTRK